LRNGRRKNKQYLGLIILDLKTLSQEIRNCKKCSLCETRTNVVIGRGVPNPEVLFVGEGPGAEEDLQGKPFVGKSGILLDRCISENGIKNFAIINIVKCRPPENRKPTSEEVKACKPWLDQQIELLSPKIIVCLGATSLNYFFPDKKISEVAGQTLTDSKGQRYVGLFHPSFALRGSIKIEDYIKSYGRINFFLGDGQTRSLSEATLPARLEKSGVREALVGDPLPSPINSPIPPSPKPSAPLPTGSQAYVPLHVHWERGSIGDVFGTDAERAEDLAQKGFTAAAITDHGSLSSLIYAQTELKARGVKPIHGLECYIDEGERAQSHLVLLVKNEIGYSNLLKLHTLSKQNTHKVFSKIYQKLTIDEICAHSDGLICSTACISGTLARRWRRDEPELVDPLIRKLQAAFGNDLYLELMPNRLEEQSRFNEYLLGLSKIYNIKMIITTDSHYNSKSDRIYHNILKAINFKSTMENQGQKKWRPPGFGDDSFCTLTTEEITELLKTNHPKIYPIRDELFANTIEVANKCNFEIPENLGDTLIGGEQESRQKILDRMDIEKYKEETKHDSKVVDDRIEKELKLIFDRGFAKYFDKVLDMCDYADENEIPRGPGRGSVGGSLVAYLLGITKVDPLRFGTLFERFLSPTRTPDIDMDFSGKKRGSVIGHLKARYGVGNVSYVITFSEFQDRVVLRDVGRVYNVPIEEIGKVTKELATKTAEDIKIEDALLVSDVVQQFNKKYPQVIDAALKLRGKIRHIGIHAAGVVICDHLQERIPTEIYDKEDSKNSLVTSWEKDALEKMGIIKFDVLGISVLDVIDECLGGAGIGWNDLPEDYNDPRVFELLKSGKTAGIFQFGSQLVTDYLRHLNPDKFEDLLSANALCRPGPLRGGESAHYIDRKNGKAWEYNHSLLEGITKDTLGILVYQEQVMQIANQIGGFSMVESERFLKLVSKSKGREAMQEKYDQFLSGAIKNGVSKEIAEDLFQKMLEFGEYAFNKIHCLEYSMLGYWTAWLKLYYPLAFYSSLINNEGDETNVLKYVKEATDTGVIIKPPSIESPAEKSTFDLKTNTLYFGLNKIKGIGPAEIEKIIEAGKNFEKIKKVRKNVFETLVSIGYLDSIESNRKQLLTGKELSRNTLFAWAENKNEDSWPEEEKLIRMRKYLTCWPRTESELLKTEYEDKRKSLSILKEEEIENKAFLSVGWVYDSKVYNNSFGKSIVLKFEDGVDRVDLYLSDHLYEAKKEFIDDLIENPTKNQVMFCLHPYFQTRGKVETRSGKLNVMWAGRTDDVLPDSILRGMDFDKIELKEKEYLITNIGYGTSKAGNKYCTVETIDCDENVTNGVLMLKGIPYPPQLGTILKGTWRKSDAGTFFKGE
jgi:DNA polymerase-3 subunit alpha